MPQEQRNSTDEPGSCISRLGVSGRHCRTQVTGRGTPGTGEKLSLDGGCIGVGGDFTGQRHSKSSEKEDLWIKVGQVGGEAVADSILTLCEKHDSLSSAHSD